VYKRLRNRNRRSRPGEGCGATGGGENAPVDMENIKALKIKTVNKYGQINKISEYEI
jgi:hypothetical protein